MSHFILRRKRRQRPAAARQKARRTLDVVFRTCYYNQAGAGHSGAGACGYADVVESVYTTDLKSVGCKSLRVRVPPSAPRRRGLRIVRDGVFSRHRSLASSLLLSNRNPLCWACDWYISVDNGILWGPLLSGILGRSESALRELGCAELHGGLPPSHGTKFHGDPSDLHHCVQVPVFKFPYHTILTAPQSDIAAGRRSFCRTQSH